MLSKTITFVEFAPLVLDKIRLEIHSGVCGIMGVGRSRRDRSETMFFFSCSPLVFGTSSYRKIIPGGVVSWVLVDLDEIFPIEASLGV